MNSQKFKTDSYCVGGKHRSGTKNITGEITINKKTGRENKLLVGKCVICNRKKSMIGVIKRYKQKVSEISLRI